MHGTFHIFYLGNSITLLNDYCPLVFFSGHCSRFLESFGATAAEQLFKADMDVVLMTQIIDVLYSEFQSIKGKAEGDSTRGEKVALEIFYWVKAISLSGRFHLNSCLLSADSIKNVHEMMNWLVGSPQLLQINSKEDNVLEALHKVLKRYPKGENMP